MKTLRRVSTVLLTLCISFVMVPIAWAHPLGNFTINQYVGLHISREMILIDYVVDMAEIPAFQEIATFDTNGNGRADVSESASYDSEKCASLQPDLKLLLNHQPVAFALTSSSVEFPAGVGGLPTLRLACEFQTYIDWTQANNTISFVNDAFADRIGWTEIVATGEGVSLQGDFATLSLSDRLTNYPQDLLASPLDERTVELEITANISTPQAEVISSVSQKESLLQDRNDAFTRLILMDDITLSTLLIALAVSFIWGALHALTPGHGKTIVGAYLVGSRGTAKHVLYLGLTTTITHTLGVFIFGLITLFAAQYILPETLFPWMTLLSGLFVVGIGINLFAGRAGRIVAKQPGRANTTYKFTAPVFEYSHVDGHSHSHPLVFAPTKKRHHSRYFDDHPHGHEKHDHYHHDHEHHHGHSHNEHSHMPPESITWRSLLALGISGGLLPCPSALVVLLGAIALNRIGLGLVLVFAFSLGLAGALTAIGLAFLYAGKLLERFPSHGRLIKTLPALSALFISLIGLGIVVKALGEIGVV